MSIADYLRALELDKNDELAYKYGLNNIVGVLYLQIDNFEFAEKYLKKAIQINPIDLKANFNLANALIELKKFDEAEDIYLNLLKTNQNDPEIHELLGYYFLYNSIDYVKAVKYFEKSIKLYTEQIEKGGDDQFALSINLYEISKAKTFLGDFRGAIEDLEKSIKSDSTLTESFHIYSQIGKNFNLMGEIQEAEKFYTLDVETMSKNIYGGLADALILRAEFYSSISSIKKSDNDFDSASKLADEETEFYSYFIRHKIKSLEYDEALKLSNKAIRIDNTNPIYNYYKSCINTILNKKFHALKELDECIFKIKKNYKLLPELVDIDGNNMGISKPFINRIKIYNTFNQNELICDDLNEFFMLTGNRLSLTDLKIPIESTCEVISKD
jgi:tetratricopeptide (TPR) repeat protein